MRSIDSLIREAQYSARNEASKIKATKKPKASLETRGRSKASLYETKIMCLSYDLTGMTALLGAENVKILVDVIGHEMRKHNVAPQHNNQEARDMTAHYSRKVRDYSTDQNEIKKFNAKKKAKKVA